jgi:hypothetical protein
MCSGNLLVAATIVVEVISTPGFSKLSIGGSGLGVVGSDVSGGSCCTVVLEAAGSVVSPDSCWSVVLSGPAQAPINSRAIRTNIKQMLLITISKFPFFIRITSQEFFRLKFLFYITQSLLLFKNHFGFPGPCIIPK